MADLDPSGQTIQLGEEKSGVGDGVDSNVVSAAVGGATGELDIDPDEAAMRGTNGEARRLGDDGGVRAHATGDEGPHAEALPFFVDHGGDNDSSFRVGRRAECGGRAHCGNATFHVRRSAAVNQIAAELGIEGRVDHSLDADDIEVAIEHQRRRAGGADRRDDVRSPGNRVLQMNLEAPVAKR